MKKDVIIWGARGHAKVLRELCDCVGRRVVAVFDNDPTATCPFADVPLFIGKAGFASWVRAVDPTLHEGMVAIGGSRGRARLELQEWLHHCGIAAALAIHPTAILANPATLGAGCQILVGAIICAEARIGDGCIVNTGASIDHESQLEAGVHVAPGAVLAGCVTVGTCAMIGAGAIILPRIRIGADAIVGAGAVVTKNVGDGEIVSGVPARRHKKR